MLNPDDIKKANQALKTMRHDNDLEPDIKGFSDAVDRMCESMVDYTEITVLETEITCDV